MTLRSIEGGKANPTAHLREANRSRLEAIKSRMDRWRMQHGARLAAMHPDVAREVESVVWTRYAAGNETPLTADDLRHCRMRVASRMRVKRYGPCTGDDEAGRQLRECLAELGEPGAEDAA